MRGKLVSAPLKTAHSCAGSTAGCVPILTIPKQPAKRIQPEPRRQTFVSGPSFSWTVPFSYTVSKLPLTRNGETISLPSPEGYNLAAALFRYCLPLYPSLFCFMNFKSLILFQTGPWMFIFISKQIQLLYQDGSKLNDRGWGSSGLEGRW